jgi:hypothetical protein
MKEKLSAPGIVQPKIHNISGSDKADCPVHALVGTKK